jgi:hypothetical protein
VTPFRRRGTELVARFEQAEVDVLVQLSSEVQGLLSQSESVEPGSPRYRAIDRLLPAAYRDGAENDEEFRRFTAEGLIDRKTRNAARVRATLADGDSTGGVVTVTLDADEFRAGCVRSPTSGSRSRPVWESRTTVTSGSSPTRTASLWMSTAGSDTCRKRSWRHSSPDLLRH